MTDKELIKTLNSAANSYMQTKPAIALLFIIAVTRIKELSSKVEKDESPKAPG